MINSFEALLQRGHTQGGVTMSHGSLLPVTAPETSGTIWFSLEVRKLDKYIKNGNKSTQTGKRVWGKLERWKKKAQEEFDLRL